MAYSGHGHQDSTSVSRKNEVRGRVWISDLTRRRWLDGGLAIWLLAWMLVISATLGRTLVVAHRPRQPDRVARDAHLQIRSQGDDGISTG